MTPEIISFAFAFTAFVISLICVAIVVGMSRATHSVQYVPHDQDPFEEISEHLKEDERIAAENEKALLDKIGPTKKREKVTAVEDLDQALEEITTSDVRFS